MAYQISQTDPAEISTKDLLSEIDGFKVLAVEVVERLSLILKTLRARRQPHPFFQDRILRFWEEIAGQTLDAEAAILLANRHTISAILPLAREQQREIAQGKMVPVATLTDTGKVTVEDMSINRMDPATLKRVFSATGIRTVDEQVKEARASGKVERHGQLLLLRDEHMMKAGNMKIPLEDVERLMRAAGYEVRFARRTVPA